MARYLTLLLMALVPFLGGCIDNAPAYDAKRLSYDEGLIGSWVLTVPKESDQGEPPFQIPVMISPRKAAVTGDRLGNYNPKNDISSREAPAYLLSVTLPKDEEKPDEPQKVLTYDAVLLSIDGATLLAYQATEDRMPPYTHMDFLPVHRVIRLDRSGDAVRVRNMKRPIVWLPTIKALDEPKGDPSLPSEDGVYFVADPDRLVKALSLAIKAPDMWDSELAMKRVATPK